MDEIRHLNPSAILSTHLLPPAIGMNDQLFDVLAEAPNAPEFSFPDRAGLVGLLATLEPVEPPGNDNSR